MIGDALAAACTDADVLARLGGPTGEAARTAAAALRRLPDAARKLERAKLAATARAVVPAGLRGIHPSWIEAALAELPPRARADLASGGMRPPDASSAHVRAAFDPVGVWLARWAAAALAPLPPADVTRPQTINEATRLSADGLVAWLADVGADQLAFALGAAAARVVPQAIERVARAPRANHLGSRRAAIARCRIELSEDTRVLIGARAIAPYTDAILRRQLALRLPRPRGQLLLAELTAWATQALDASPTWDALGAPP